MDLTIVIGLLVIVVTIITPIIAFLAYQKASKLEAQIRQLKLDLHDLRNGSLDEPHSERTKSEATNPTLAIYEANEPLANLPAVEITVNHTDQQETKFATQADLMAKPISPWFEKCLTHIRDNWLVWIGGLALVVGAGYLVQIVGSNFTFSPIVRVLAAALFSSSLISLGEVTHRKINAISSSFISLRADAYIPAALYAAGMSGLYATVLFSTVVYQFFTPSLALSAMASLALVCLALTLRLGPLMAALGLFGGYSAPFWIGGESPNYVLLSCYINAITIAGLLTYLRSKQTWLPLALTVAHCGWLLLLIFNIPDEILTLWYVVSVSLSTLLLVFTPYMGLELKLRYRHANKWQYSQPIIPAVALSLVSLAYLEQTLFRDNGAFWFFLYPILILVLPILRGNLAPRRYYPVTALGIICIELGAIAINNVATSTLLWSIIAFCSVIAMARCTTQYLLGDRSTIAYWMAVITLPGLLVTNLLYLELQQFAAIYFWAVFAVFTSVVALLIAIKTKRLIQETSSSLHLVALTLSYCFLNSEWLAISISLQIVTAAWQHTKNRYSPGILAIKIMMATLIVLVSAVPFIPELQFTLIGSWSSVLESYVPAIVALWVARQMFSKQQLELSEWLEGSILHLVVLLVFAQTNYWLLGSFNFVFDINFYSISLFISQAVALFAVYQFKLKHSVQLKLFYHGYCYLLLSVIGVLFLILNTVYQPLLNSYVTGTDLPIINWLAPGWLAPALLVLGISYYKLYTSPIKDLYLNVFAAVAFGLWVTFSIRQFWQTGSMMIDQPTSMAEMFSYSVALIIAGAATTYLGVRKAHKLTQKVGLITLGVTVCKVFILDTAALEGIWRAISFLGLGGSLIALGWLFQRLHYRTGQEGKAELRTEN